MEKEVIPLIKANLKVLTLAQGDSEGKRNSKHFKTDNNKGDTMGGVVDDITHQLFNQSDSSATMDLDLDLPLLPKGNHIVRELYYLN